MNKMTKKSKPDPLSKVTLDAKVLNQIKGSIINCIKQASSVKYKILFLFSVESIKIRKSIKNSKISIIPDYGGNRSTLIQTTR